MTTRADLHAPVDQIPDSQLAAAAYLRHVGSEPDDEELTPEDLATGYEINADMAPGRYVSLEELRA